MTKVAATLAATAGCTGKYLLDTARALPPDLRDDEESLTLVRAANKLCGVKKAQRTFTNTELMLGVTGVINKKIKACDVQVSPRRLPPLVHVRARAARLD